MWELWSLSRIVEPPTMGAPGRWAVDWGAFREARIARHRSFSLAGSLAAMAAMRHLASTLNQNVDTMAMRYLKPLDEWTAHERVKLGLDVEVADDG